MTSESDATSHPNNAGRLTCDCYLSQLSSRQIDRSEFGPDNRNRPSQPEAFSNVIAQRNAERDSGAARIRLYRYQAAVNEIIQQI